MFERLWAGDVAVLGDVADKKRRDVLPLRRKQQLGRRFADLTDAAGRRLKSKREHGLNRINDDECRFETSDLFENAFKTGFREDVQRRAFYAKSFTTLFDLVFRFFAGAVQHRSE